MWYFLMGYCGGIDGDLGIGVAKEDEEVRKGEKEVMRFPLGM